MLGIAMGYSSICMSSFLDRALNLSIFPLLKESARPFSFVLMCLAYNLTFIIKHCRVMILISTMQFLHLDD